jgi:hypothetical protein
MRVSRFYFLLIALSGCAWPSTGQVRQHVLREYHHASVVRIAQDKKDSRTFHVYFTQPGVSKECELVLWYPPHRPEHPSIANIKRSFLHDHPNAEVVRINKDSKGDSELFHVYYTEPGDNHEQEVVLLQFYGPWQQGTP